MVRLDRFFSRDVIGRTWISFTILLFQLCWGSLQTGYLHSLQEVLQ